MPASGSRVGVRKEARASSLEMGNNSENIRCFDSRVMFLRLNDVHLSLMSYYLDINPVKVSFLRHDTVNHINCIHIIVANIN